MKYAVIRIGGKQFKVEEGSVFKLPRQKTLATEVLLFSDGKKIEVGTPIVKGVTVKVEVLEETSEKTRVARYRSKSRYRKVTGHKQPISILKVKSIGTKPEKKAAEKTSAKKAPVKKAATKKTTTKKGTATKATK